MLIKSSKAPLEISVWPFAQLDANCRILVIKGLWLFSGRLDADAMQHSLEKLLDFYPYLAGRICGNGISMNNAGAEWNVAEKPECSLKMIREMKDALDKFNPGIRNSDAFKGKTPLLSVQLTYTGDGTALCVHCCHVCLDGDGFYAFVNNWSKLHRGEQIDVSINKPDILMQHILTKEKATELAIKAGWHKLGLSVLWMFVKMKIGGVFNRVSDPILITDDQIAAIKQSLMALKNKRYSTSSILSAWITKEIMQLNGAQPQDSYTQLTVLDIRERLPEIGANYTGNAMTTLTTLPFTADTPFADLVDIIDRSVKEMLADRQRFKEFVELNMETANLKVPYVPIDLKGMNARRPTAVYINNMRRFPVYKVDFGKGKAIWAAPNDLSDIVKIWPAPPEEVKGVYVYVRGYLADKINKSKGDFLKKAPI